MTLVEIFQTQLPYVRAPSHKQGLSEIPLTVLNFDGMPLTREPEPPWLDRRLIGWFWAAVFICSLSS